MSVRGGRPVLRRSPVTAGSRCSRYWVRGGGLAGPLSSRVKLGCRPRWVSLGGSVDRSRGFWGRFPSTGDRRPAFCLQTSSPFLNEGAVM